MGFLSANNFHPELVEEVRIETSWFENDK